MATPSRPLTGDELRILRYIQELYGEQNIADEVFVTGNDEAVLFVRDRSGGTPLMVDLTNVGQWAREENLSREQTCERYLVVK